MDNADNQKTNVMTFTLMVSPEVDKEVLKLAIESRYPPRDLQVTNMNIRALPKYRYEAYDVVRDANWGMTFEELKKSAESNLDTLYDENKKAIREAETIADIQPYLRFAGLEILDVIEK